MAKKSVTEVLKYFQFSDKNKVLKKLQTIIAGGKNNLHLLFDFDRTLTVGKNNTGEDFTSWNILTKLLPPKAFAKQYKLYQKYRPIEASGKLSAKDATSWANQVLKIIVENQVNLLEMEKDFLQNTSIRSHAKNIFDACNILGIPIVIVSAGIKNVIDIWSKIFQVSPALVLAVKLIADTNGKIIDWDKNIIHVGNKGEQGNEELDKIKNQRPNIIAVGDAIEDADMVKDDENVLRIRINDPRIDEKLSEAERLKKTFAKFDLMIDSGTLEPVLKILELLE